MMSWVRRLPWRTLRVQLVLLYAGAFFATGVAVLLVPILTIKQSIPEGANAAAIAQIEADTRMEVIRAAASLAGLVLLSLAIGWLIAGRLLRPLRTITATARDISASNLDRRLALGARHDEFSELGETLDSLFGRLEASFESQRRFVANASHELRTPLTAERTLLQVALADPDADAESCARPARSCSCSASSRSASSRRCSRWRPVSAASIAGSPSTSPNSPGR